MATKPKAPPAEKVKAWVSMTQDQLLDRASRFMHLTSKVNNTVAAPTSVRLASTQRKPGLPYIGLTTLGAPRETLDFCEGGAASIPLVRQMKDQVTGLSSGVTYDKSTMTLQEEQALAPGGAVRQVLDQHAEMNTSLVHPLFRQVIVYDENLHADVALTPLGSVGLSQMIMDRLDQELERRRTLAAEKAQAAAPTKDVKAPYVPPFWKSVVTAMGGQKPQNVSLLCAVAGGRNRAKFALLFGGPSLPDQRIRRHFSALYRGIPTVLARADQSGLHAALLSWRAQPGLKTMEALSKRLTSLVQKQKTRVKAAYGDMERALLADLRASKVDTMALGTEPLKAFWKLDTTAQEALAETFQIKTRSEIAEGWLKQDFQNRDWARKASDDLIGAWARQLKWELSTSERKAMGAVIFEEMTR